MHRSTLRSLLAHKLRLVLSAMAVVIGVAFVGGTLIFSNTLDRTFTDLFDGTVPDVSVRPKTAFELSVMEMGPPGAGIPDAAVAKVRTVEGVDRAAGAVEATGVFLLDRQGKLIGGGGPPGLGVNWVDGYPGVRIVEGRAPRADDEVSIDAITAGKGDYHVGDTVTLLTPGPRLQMKVVGLMRYGDAASLAGASIAAVTNHVAQSTLLARPSQWTSIAVMGREGVPDAVLSARVAAALGSDYTVKTRAEAVDEGSKQVKQALNFFRIILLVFAGISLFVGTFIILNTFSMLVAQRTRELALLRAVGASRRQVSASVLGEAFVVGVVGSTLGLLAGFGLALGLKAMFDALGLELQSGLVVTPSVVLWCYLVGVVVTVVAAYVPARRASRIAPVAAMRDDVGLLPERSLRLRAALGTVSAVSGALALAVGVTRSGQSAALTVAAGAALLVGAAITLSPVLSRPFITAVGFFLPRVFGPVGALAEDNARRNPRRTAATSSALMIGLAIVAAFGVVGASAKSSIDQMVDRALGTDFIVTNGTGTAFSVHLGDELAPVPGVAHVYRARQTPMRLAGATGQVAAYEPGMLGDAVHVTWLDGGDAGLATDGLVVDASTAKARGWHVGDRVPVQFQYGGAGTLTVSGVYQDNAGTGSYGVGMATYAAANTGAPLDSVLFVTTEPGADQAQLRRALTSIVAAYPIATLRDQTEFKADQRAQIDQLLYIFYALAALAVIVAILGIVNTLALSVIERTREIGLLRAVGLGRRQLKRMIRLESLVIAIYGAVLGLGLGLTFGVALQRAMRSEGIEVLTVPIAQVGVFFVLAAVIGVLASMWPARRAARLDVLRAVTTE